MSDEHAEHVRPPWHRRLLFRLGVRQRPEEAAYYHQQAWRAMQRYLGVQRREMDAISGVNSVMRGGEP